MDEGMGLMLAVALAVIIVWLASVVESQPAVSDAHHLARVCKLEAEGSAADCDAIYWIGRKRFRGSWLDGLLLYSRLYSRDNDRAQRIARLPWGPIPGASKRENRQWARIRARAAALVAGKRPDPCPRAVHWGGTVDSPRGRQIPATCAAQGRTKNTLYVVGD